MVEARITGSMGTLVLVVTFRFPALVRLVVREVFILMALLLPRLGFLKQSTRGPQVSNRRRGSDFAGDAGRFGTGLCGGRGIVASPVRARIAW